MNALSVTITNQQAGMPIQESALEQLVTEVLTQQGITQAEISIVIVDNSTIHGINVAYLEHDFPTDVITFPLNDDTLSPVEQGLEGEIVISAEMAEEMAQTVGWSTWDELRLYLIHGLLHLCGYDDLDETSLQKMRQREWEMLHHLHFPIQVTDSRYQGLGAPEGAASPL